MILCKVGVCQRCTSTFLPFFLGHLLILAVDYSEKKTRTSKAFSVALGRSKLTDWSDTRTRVHNMSINFFLMHSSNLFCESFRSLHVFFLLSCWLSSWSGLDYLASLSWSVWNFGALKTSKLLKVATTTIKVCVTTDCRFNFCLFCQGERVAYIYPDLKTVIQGSFHQVHVSSKFQIIMVVHCAGQIEKWPTLATDRLRMSTWNTFASRNQRSSCSKSCLWALKQASCS